MAFGFGGLNAPYPTRSQAPSSQVVEALPYASDWLADFNARWEQEATRPTTETPTAITTQLQLRPGAVGYSDTNWQRAGLSENPYDPSKTYGGGSHMVAVTDYMSNDRPRDFSMLEAERARMLPLMEAQTANQQAYDRMSGNYQWNGVMSNQYSNPGFGQINGDFGQNAPTPDAFKGVDMSWADGMFNPSQGNGAFGSQRKQYPWQL